MTIRSDTMDVAGRPLEADETNRLISSQKVDGTAVYNRNGDRLGTVKDAVQPGRRIASLRKEAGLALPIAFMS